MRLFLLFMLLFQVFNLILCSNKFIWGVATSAYQIEGGSYIDGKGDSIWDIFTHNKMNITGDIADLSYFQYLSDIKLIRNLNVKYYRFSISWTRILPKGKGKINQRGVNYYNKLINNLIQNNITPVITLYHWDLPQALEDEYSGWLNPQIQYDFLNYADICFLLFGDRVKWWITINEPWTFSVNGYVSGVFAPGRCSNRLQCLNGNSSIEAYVVAHNVILSHAKVVELYRKVYQNRQKGLIGITLNIDWSFPLNSSSIIDQKAAIRRNEFMFGWFADPIFFGTYPKSMKDYVGSKLPIFSNQEINLVKGSLDFLGFNHYSSWYTTQQSSQQSSQQEGEKGGWFDDQQTIASKYDLNGNLIGPQGGSSWLNSVPSGMLAALKWVDERYNKPTILITENGCDIIGENDTPLPDVLNDSFRVNYFRNYLESVGRAIEIGINIIGYFAWSLLDNFEWADGYSMRFGLYYVDFHSPNRTRYPKRSSFWYRDYITSHKSGPTSNKKKISKN